MTTPGQIAPAGVIPPPPAPATAAARAALRQQLLTQRLALAPASKQAWDEAIGQRLLAQCAPLPALLGVYWPLQGEPDLRGVYAALAARGVRLALPVVVAREAPLRFAHWTPDMPMAAGTFAVPVPAHLAWVEPQTVLVPCLGFNSARMRLGYGGGFYDRTLAQAARPATIGIAYSCLQVEFEAAPHDIALDCILTENACL